MGRKRHHKTMICARCGQSTPGDPCVHCGESPILDRRYRLHDVLGTGAEGTTYRASQLDDGRIVALKEMPLRRARDDKGRELLHREAEILRQLHHEGIPRYLDDFTAGEGKNRAFYLVQEYIDGQTLIDEERDHRYDVAEVMAILEQILDVLVYLHGLSPPVIHRDVKPSNVMRRRNGGLVLIDFGSVRGVLADEAMGGETVTGTFGYMAPEQMMGDASEASDLYGLGALAVRLLSRVEPHTLLRHDRKLDWEPHVQAPRPVMKLLHSLLQPDPARRASNAIEVRETVRRIRWKSDAELNGSPSSRVSPMTDLVAMLRRRGSADSPPRDREEDAGDTERTFTPVGLTVIVWLGITLLAFIGYPLLRDRDSGPDESSPVEVAAVEPWPSVAATAPDVVSSEITVGSEGLVETTRFDVGTGTYPPRNGEVDPEVAIVVFSDFACSYCERLSHTLAQLDLEFGNRVAVYFRDYPLDLHPDAYGAHEAARCANEQGVFWNMHGRLFANQRQLGRSQLESYGLTAGLEYHTFLDCMRTGTTRLDIEIDRKAGREAGVEATPTYFINGTRYSGAHGIDVIREHVVLALAQAQASAALGEVEKALER